MVLFTNSLFLDILGILSALIVVVITKFKWNYGYWKRKNLPYLEGRFPFGCLQNPFARSKLSLGDQILKMYEKGKANGWRQFGIFIISTPTYVSTDLKFIQNILSKNFNHFTERGAYHNEQSDPLSANLFAIGGEKWRNLRRKLSPTFTSGKMKEMFKTITHCGEVLDEVMQKNINFNEPIDIKNVLGNFTTDVIGSCAFGLECNSFKNDDSLFRYYGKKVFHSSPLRTLKINISNSYPNLAKRLNIVLIPSDVSNFFLNIVKDTIKYREDNNEVRKDFLQLLMQMKSYSDEYKGDGNTLTVNEIAAQCFIFFLAGFETSATTMTFSLLEMSRNQEIQDKVREEVNEVLARHNGEITYDAINEMKYMGQVIDEALRMYPPVPFINRVCEKDYKIPDQDFIIEKGTSVLIPIKGIHLDEDNFPEPYKFDPDRFSDENKHNIKHYSHMPFGEGQRICIGARFGIMQSKVGLAVLLRKYKFFLNNKTQQPIKMNPSSFISTVQGDVWLDVKKIDD